MNTKFWVSGLTGIILGLTSSFVLAGYEWNYDEYYDFDDSDDNSSFAHTKSDSTHVSSGYQWVYNEHYDFDDSEDNYLSHADVKRSTNGKQLTTSSIITGMQ